MPAPKDLKEALIEECKDLLHAEKQLVRALPRMAKKATNDQLRNAFEQRTEETKVHVERLEQAIESMGKKATAKKCPAMLGIVEEGKELMDEIEDEGVLDAMLIGAAQKAEHYEIASYGTACTWAKQLGEDSVLKLLKQNMSEEEEADQKLSKIAESVVNRRAMA